MNYSSAKKHSGEKFKLIAKEKLPEAIFNLNSFLQLPNDGHFLDQVALNLKKCETIFTELELITEVIFMEWAPLFFAKKICEKSNCRFSIGSSNRFF